MEMRVPSPPESLEEFQRATRQAIIDARKEMASELDPRVAPALALAPHLPAEFTPEIVNSTRLLNAGWLQIGDGPRVWEGKVVWMERADADSALQQLRATYPADFGRITTDSLHSVGALVLELAGDKLGADPTLARWAALAVAADAPRAFESVLRGNVEQALRRSMELRAQWSPEARAWIEAAEPIGAALEGAFQAAVAGAKRRFELFHRRSYDRARLANYFCRDELDRYFFDLLGDEQRWALHFLGAGGSGKTMLLRHVGVELADKAGAAVSRVDFDYLNPQYPERDPLLLLKALAEEFRLDESGDSIRAFTYFDDECESVYRRIEKAARVGEPTRVSLGEPDVRSAVRAFAEGLAALSRRAQPVLILDTCEELAKVQPGGGVPPNVTHTLQLLETLQQNYRELTTDGRGLRVIFSGRRMLPQLEWIRVCPVGGFTEREAAEFLQTYHTASGRRVRAELMESILSVTRVDGHSPYDLDTYAAWAAMDETLTRDKLKNAGPLLYMRERIVDRLTPLVRRLLPALATLGRFDKEILLRLIGATADAAKDLDETVSQEWVLPDAAGMVDTYRLDDLFRQRVLKYYATEPAARQAARERLAEILPPLTETRPFRDLTPQLIASCLDVLSDRPGKAAEWWERFEERIAREAEWNSAAEFLRILEPPPENPGPFAAGIYATKAAVQLHLGNDPKAEWQTVEAQLAAYPPGEPKARLQWRLECAMGRATGRPSTRDQDWASWLAMFERRVEARGAADAWFGRATPDDLSIFAALLTARSAAFPASLPLFKRAAELCRRAKFDTRQVWLDWIRPANLTSRVLLELALAAPGEFPGELRDLAMQVLDGPLDSIDSDRFAAAWLRAAVRRSGYRASELGPRFAALHRSSVDLVRQMPVCRAHHAVRPLFIVLLEARGLAGEVETALEELKLLSAQQKTLPEGIPEELDRVSLRIIVRMRLMSEGYAIPAGAASEPLAAIARALQGHPLDLARDYRSDDPVEQAEINFLSGAPVTPTGPSAAQDPTGWLEAVTLMALAEARSGRKSQSAHIIGSIGPVYRQLTEGRPNVPEWQAIEQAARSGEAVSLLSGMGDRPAVWRPWVARILACLAPDEPQENALGAWVLRTETSVVDSRTVIAPELAWLRGVKPGRPWRKWAETAVGVLGFCVFAAIVLTIYKGYVWVLGQIGLQLRTAWRVASFVVVVPLAIWLAARVPKLFSILLDVYSRILELTVEVEPVGVSPDINRPLLAPTAWKNTFRLGRVTWKFDKGTHPASEQESYEAIWREWYPKGRRRTAASILFEALNLYARMCLWVDDATAAAPWEALMNGSHFAAVRRVVKTARNRPQEPWRAPVTVVEWGRRPSRSTRSETRADWGDRFRFSYAATAEEFAEASSRTGVARIVGTPFEGPTGLSMRVQPAATEESPWTVRAADVARQYPALRMLILQCPPGEIGRRLSSDRKAAAVMKRIGAEAFAAGIPIVIVIPVLPDAAADSLLGSLYSVIGRQPANAVPLVEVAVAAFQRSQAQTIASPEIGEEVVQDLCLYAADRVSFRFDA